MQGYADEQDGVQSRARELVELYEKLKDYQPKDVEAIYEAMQRGESGKCFFTPKGTLVVKKHSLEFRV